MCIIIFGHVICIDAPLVVAVVSVVLSTVSVITYKIRSMWGKK